MAGSTVQGKGLTRKISDITIKPHSDIVIAIGKKLEGKSYAVNKLLSQETRLIVWDYNHEHDGKDKIRVSSLEALHAIWKNPFINTKRIAYQPPRRRIQDFDKFIKTILTLRYLALEIEELRVYTMKNKTPDSFMELLDTGRHKNIGIFCTSRRAKGIAVDVLFNADKILAFRQHRPEDIKYLGEFKTLGRPVLVGVSRKAFIEAITGGEPLERRDGTIAAVVASIINGANIVRVHDAAVIKKAATLTDAIMRG